MKNFKAVNINDLIPGIVYLDKEDITGEALMFVKYHNGVAWFAPIDDTWYMVHYENDDCYGLVGFDVEDDDKCVFYTLNYSPHK